MSTFEMSNILGEHSTHCQGPEKHKVEKQEGGSKYIKDSARGWPLKRLCE